MLDLELMSTSKCFNFRSMELNWEHFCSIDQFLINAGNIEQFEQNATVDQALEKLGLQAIVQPLTNMTVALMPHQAIGVAWMIDREQGPTKGGCLADEMGLGKVRLSLISV